jgi:hypothetical protein
MPELKIRKNPNEGRYVRCSKITSFIGIKLDSIDSVRKNQKMPKEMNLYLLKENMARMISAKSIRKLSRVLISKKVFEIGKS